MHFISLLIYLTTTFYCCFLYKLNIDCISGHDAGFNYKGNISKAGYQSCVPWNTVKDSPLNVSHNHCRNPDNRSKTWCYTYGPQTHTKTYCDITYCGFYCDDIPHIPNTLQPTELVRYKDGDLAAFQCKTGYDLIGTDSILCHNPDGRHEMAQWGDQFPVCLAKCQNMPHMIQQVKTKGFHNGDVVKFACDEGYNVVGDRVISCLETGLWNGSIPNCDAVTCPNLTISSHMIQPEKSTGYRYNEIVNFACDRGYNLVGNRLMACLKTGQWNGSTPICKVVTCPNPSTPMHMTQQQKTSDYHYKELVKFSCDEGYNVVGNSVISCLETGYWNGSAPKCKLVTCPNLTIPQYMTQPMRTTGYHYHELANFSCKKGYKVVGDRTISCQGTGQWNGSTPICEVITCERLNTPYLNWFPNKTLYSYNTTVTFACGDIPSQINSTCQNNGEESFWTKEPPLCKLTSDDQNNGAIIGCTVTVFVVVSVVLLAIIIVRRRKLHVPKSPEASSTKPPSMSTSARHIYSDIDSTDIERKQTLAELSASDKVYVNKVDEKAEIEGYYSFNVGSQIPKNAIEVKRFYEYVEKGRTRNGKFEQEFQDLKYGLQKLTTVALKPENKSKNKYKDMYAYDETRVTLDTDDDYKSDYINASFIQGYGHVRKYIASQGPQDKTVDDFWRMVWQYDSERIVMLTNVYENGKGKERKQTTQFHFTAWPDKDVPKCSSTLVNFRNKVNCGTASKGPITVHCSAGVGRTGTYIALDYIVNEAQERDYVQVYRTVEMLRNQRVNMVQTKHQYVFLHDAVLEAILCPKTVISVGEFPDHYKRLLTFDTAEGKDKLLIEYERMNSVSSRYDEEDFVLGKSAENRAKNRYLNMIPVESEIPKLSTAVEGHNEYINAVFLPGYKDRRSFIVTQMPLTTTAVDFWRLVYDYDIATIVKLNQGTEDKASGNTYLPEDGSTVPFGPFRITKEKREEENAFTRMVITVQYKNTDQYKFLHEAVAEYLKLFDTYANLS